MALSINVSVATELQAAFEVTPSPGTAGWLGGDSDVSVRIAGNRSLWIFADSFVGPYDMQSQTRSNLVTRGGGTRMPHSTVAITHCAATCAHAPTFHWRRDAAGRPATFFELQSAPWIWPVAAISSRRYIGNVCLRK